MATARLSSQARRAAILNAAVRLFSEKGFRGVTTRALAAACGVSEPVLYHHFATKSDLYRAIIEERAVEGDRAIPAMIEEKFDCVADDRDFLVRLANGIIAWHAKDPTYARLLVFAGLEGHELSHMFQERYTNAFLDGISRYFARRMDEGVFRRMNPAIAAETFVGTTANFGMSQAVFGSQCLNLPLEELVEGFVDIFLEGMKKRP